MLSYPKTMLAVFALTLFTSATLLMSVQPLIGKLSTPLLGGTPAVWNTCMLFFMVLLLGGYAYAHFTTKWLGVRKQAIVHLVLLALPFLFFPIAVNKDLILRGSLDNPIPQLLLLLVTSVGVPFFVVSTSAPLLQKWFSSTTNPAAKDPYFLYGASNLGSMIGLLSYPVFIERHFFLSTQGWMWPVGYTLLVLCIAGCAIFMWLSPAAKPEEETSTTTATKQLETQPALALATAAPGVRSEGIQAAAAKVGVSRGRDKKNRRRDRGGRSPEHDEAAAEPLPVELSGNVTWKRRMRWVLLAAVPSSLMLGATTYMTTDIAAIPFLWVLPLELYLLTFIIVFSKIPPLVQSILVFLAVEAGCVILGTVGLAYTNLDDSIIWLLRVMIIAGGIAAFWILTFRVHNLIHICCIGALPLIVLLLIFMMLSEIKPPKIAMTIAIHLVTLFIVSMVCHGELARDRPPTKYLTEYFLWISFGGVVGGIFNALIAPVIFNAIVEYQLAMVVACLLVPPLGMGVEARLGVVLDLGLTALCLTVGTVLVACRLWENDLAFAHLAEVPGETYFWLITGVLLVFGMGLYATLRYRDEQAAKPGENVWVPLALFFGTLMLNLLGLWGFFQLSRQLRPHDFEPAPRWVVWGVMPPLILACLALNAGVAYLLYRRRMRPERMQGMLDLTLPFAILVLVAGLILGLQSQVMLVRQAQLSQQLGQMPSQIRVIFTFGIPAVLCYTFAERSLRFGLCVGTMILAAVFSGLFDEGVIYQERSFFGVLRVEDDGRMHRLVHGTTLHGAQYTNTADGSDTLAITYYHPTGPVGRLCLAYNQLPPGNTALATGVGMVGKRLAGPRPMGVIGLGTGSMACWSQPGQQLTFYDIDPVVRRITFTSAKYFTFVQQARDRGVHVNLIMGDALLTMQRQQLRDDEKYQILVVDAFSSDAIPIHLITYEALSLYLDKLADDGIICFHISNRYLNLKPVLGNLAARYTREHYTNEPDAARKQALVGYYMEDGEDAIGKTASTWVVLARDPKHLMRLGLYDAWDAKVGLESAEDTLDYRLRRFKAMQEKSSEFAKDQEVHPMINWDDVRPDSDWDKTRPTLRKVGVMAAELQPQWVPLPVDPYVGEWTNDYSALWTVFRW